MWEALTGLEPWSGVPVAAMKARVTPSRCCQRCIHAFISITPQCGFLVHDYATHSPFIQLSAGERLPLPPLLPPPLRNLIQGMWAAAPNRPSAAATGVHESQPQLRFIEAHAAAAHQLRMMGARKPSYPERFSRCAREAAGCPAACGAGCAGDACRAAAKFKRCEHLLMPGGLLRNRAAALLSLADMQPSSQLWFSAAHTGLKFFKRCGDIWHDLLSIAVIFGRKSRGPPASTACMSSWVCLKIKRSGFVARS
jgi:hypothetical protein